MQYFRVATAKHPFYYTRLKNDVWSVSEHFANLRPVKRWKTCVSSLNALFWGIEVVMHAFYSGWPKIMVGSVLDRCANLRTQKDVKHVFWAWMYYFRTAKLRSIHSTTLDPKWCLVVFQSISLTFGTLKDAMVLFRAWMHYFEVSKLRCIHSTLVDPK
jgi:hypothetical protein